MQPKTFAYLTSDNMRKINWALIDSIEKGCTLRGIQTSNAIEQWFSNLIDERHLSMYFFLKAYYFLL
jgi:hypothetical protein